MIVPARGVEFIHSAILAPATRTADRTYARMRITAVRRDQVYFTYADSPTNKGSWTMGRDAWIARYG